MLLRGASIGRSGEPSSCLAPDDFGHVAGVDTLAGVRQGFACVVECLSKFPTRRSEPVFRLSVPRLFGIET